MKAAALLVALALTAVPARAADDVPATPTSGPARSIGSAANGCLAGAAAMPQSGPGWEVLRPERNRFWGNPALVAFLEDMAGRTSSLGRLLIADMAQPRGGHMTYGHGSHQTGIDVDILYRLGEGPLSADERAHPAMDEVLVNGVPDAAHWGQRQVDLLKAFASDERVERIFVNAAIKRSLCTGAGTDRVFLTKLRPWWGHADHFHVRLRCPAQDHDCISGQPLPAGDGCGAELDWWFGKEASAGTTTPAKPRPRPTPPAACQIIWAAPGSGNTPADIRPASGPRD